jgi:Fe-S-cluster containining protein
MIKQFIAQEFCLRCQGCCRFSQEDSVWSPCLSDEDLKEFSRNNLSPSVVSYHKKIRLIPFQKQNNFLCSLLGQEDNRCKIYSFRPFECQLYPFLINRKGKKVFLAIDLKCPYAEENLESEIFKKYTRYLVERLNRPRRLSILRNNPQIIQEYPGVLNLVELKI